VTTKAVLFVGGIWAPLFPNVSEIEFDCCPSANPRTFAGLRFSRIAVNGVEHSAPFSAEDFVARFNPCLAFDGGPWAAAFRAGDSVAAALAGRRPKAIAQASGFVPPECLDWPQLRDCGSFAFAFARFRSFDFRPRVARLGSYAFAGSSLESVALPDSVASVGVGCFADCRSLREARLGRGVRGLPRKFFDGCTSLRFLRAAAELEGIGEGALWSARSLRGFDFACLAPTADIEEDAFRGSGLVTVTLAGVSRLCRAQAFAECSALREAEVGLAKIPSSFFSDCRALERVTLGEVAEIRRCAFAGCVLLRSIDLSALDPDAEIGDHAFERSGLVDVALPATLRSIRAEAFAHCQSLTRVRLPRTLGSLGQAVFKGCISLRAIALGDVRGKWKDPAGLLGGVKVDRLELIGADFQAFERLPIADWLAPTAVIVAEEFAGRTVCGFPIVSA
jgi:hypothetical protein